MNFKVRRWRLVLRLLVLALIVSAVPLPCAAQQAASAPARPGLKASISPIVSAVAAKTAPARAQAQPSDARAQLESKSFFRTTVGVVVLAVVGAGIGYAAYSAKHDRIPPNSNR